MRALAVLVLLAMPALAGEPTLDLDATLDAALAPTAETEAAPQSYVLMLEPEADLEALSKAWAILEPDLSRARAGARVIELRLASEFAPEAVLDLLRATRGVEAAEPNFTLEREAE